MNSLNGASGGGWDDRLEGFEGSKKNARANFMKPKNMKLPKRKYFSSSIYVSVYLLCV